MGTMNIGGVWAMVVVMVMMVPIVPMVVVASDPDPLQDFCVADLTSDVVVNGFPCKPAAQVTAWDFWSPVLSKPGNTNNIYKFAVTPAFVQEFPGLNTQGLSAVRLDFAKGGLNPPHFHPRASEILLVLKGELYVGFVSTNGANNTLFTTTVKAGELFVFPRGLIHFQLNVGNGPVLAFGALNSQNGGVQIIAPALFGAEPPINDKVLETGFQISQSEVDEIRQKFA